MRFGGPLFYGGEKLRNGWVNVYRSRYVPGVQFAGIVFPEEQDPEEVKPKGCNPIYRIRIKVKDAKTDSLSSTTKHSEFGFAATRWPPSVG